MSGAARSRGAGGVVNSSIMAAKVSMNRAAAVSSSRAYRYRKATCNWPSAVTTETARPRGMCTGAENAIRTGPPGPDHGGPVTLPRLESMVVSHTTRPTMPSETLKASRFSATGHQPGVASKTPAEAPCGRACLIAINCLLTSASSTGGWPTAVPGPTVTVTIRVWLPATVGRPGPCTLTGTLIAIVRGTRR
jgi:hypothetical protein